MLSEAMSRFGQRCQSRSHGSAFPALECHFPYYHRVVAAAVGLSLCQAGNAADLLSFAHLNVPAFWLRVWGVQKGYSMG